MKNCRLKTLMGLALLILLCMGQLFTVYANGPSAWAVDILEQAKKEKLFVAFSNYQAGISRKDFCRVTALFIKAEMDEEFIAEIISKAGNPFSDTNDNDILLCYGAGIVIGMGEGKFSPDMPLTREQAAVIMMNAIAFIEKHQSSDMLGLTPPSDILFGDAQLISPWAVNAVSIASRQGILKGDGVNFNPLDPVTCEQAIILSYQSGQRLEQQGMGGSYTQAELDSIRYIISEYKRINVDLGGDFYIQRPSARAPYSIGAVNPRIANQVLDSLNLARYIAGVPNDIVNDAEYTSYAQAGAVLLDRIGYLDHLPEKPADMDDEFYEMAYKGTSESNLSQSYMEEAPDYSIWMYMHDSDENNIAVVGHRRWALNPKMAKSAVGMSGFFTTLYAFDESRSASYDKGFVPWPGNVFPTNLFKKDMAWSVSLDESYLKNVDAGNVKITVTRQRDNRSWVISRAVNMADGSFFNLNKNNYGGMAALIFRPPYRNEDALYMKNDVFLVEVEGLAKPLTYTVKLFDPKDTGKLVYTQAR